MSKPTSIPAVLLVLIMGCPVQGQHTKVPSETTNLTANRQASMDLVSRAIDLADKENHSGAIELLTRAIALDSQNAQAFFERGMACLNLDKDAEGAADFDRALAINPNFPGARDWRARAAESLGDHKRAAEERLLDLRANPGGPVGLGVSPQSWADCADAFIRAGEPQKARELLEEYFRKHVMGVSGYVRYETAPMRIFAKLLITAGESKRAVEFAKTAYSSKHRVPTDIAVYAHALESSGDFQSARLICEEGLKVNDQIPELLELRQRLLQEKAR